MFVSELTLHNFRNYTSCTILFSKGINILTGNNAQGKTNLLESLVYTSLTRSHRIANEKKLIKEGCDFASIECTVMENSQAHSMKAIIHRGGRTLFLHNQPVKKNSDFIGNLNVVFFSPDHLNLFSDSPMERRKLINQEAGKISKEYIHALNHYQNILKKRNFLLKQPHIDEIYLDTLDDMMSQEESILIHSRMEIVQCLNETIQPYYRFLSGEKDASLYIRYACCTQPDQATKEHLIQLHETGREKDREYHTTCTGIHREDFQFMLNDRNVIETASQGQKRMIMLALKLSLHYYIKKTTGRDAVLLLDDVLSELDRNVQSRLLEICRKAEQCIITATELPVSLQNTSLHEYSIQEGIITDKGGNTNGRR